MSTALLQALQDPAVFGGEDPVELIETGISWVLLVGSDAYKIKKPVNLGFLDYRKLEQRRQCCREELRRNGWLAPTLYREVVTFTGSESAPRLGGEGPVLEYAVRMRRFPQDDLLSNRANAGYLMVSWMDGLAADLAAFHRQTGVVPPSLDWGGVAHVRAWTEDNLTTLRQQLANSSLLEELHALGDWSDAELSRRQSLFQSRKAAGMIRQCHGDLHLNNVVVIDDRATPFDAIEFSAELSAIDVLNEVAFLLMDLDFHGYRGLGFRFLEQYLAHLGRPDGLGVLPFYGVYRALVRAKVAALTLDDGHPDQKAPTLARCEKYLEVARHWSQPPPPLLLITHGLSGSGKSSLSERLLESLEAVRFRSDVVRKALHGLAPNSASGAAPGAGIYDQASSQRTYQRLRELAAEALSAGLSVILDATFLERQERAAIRALAQRLGVAMVILDCAAPLHVLRFRISSRQARGKDASEADGAILEHQLRNQQPLGDEELACTVTVDSQTRPSVSTLTRRLRHRARVPG